MEYLGEKLNQNPLLEENEASSKFFGNLMILDYILNRKSRFQFPS